MQETQRLSVFNVPFREATPIRVFIVPGKLVSGGSLRVLTFSYHVKGGSGVVAAIPESAF